MRFQESNTFTPGKDITVFDTKYGRFGVAVCFDVRFPELFRAMAEGYLYYMNRHMTAAEKELLVYACWLMTMEKGINYLTDYLNGDMYSYDFADEKQNLYRAVNQFFLVLDMEDKKEQMEQIIKEVLMSAPSGYY